VSETETESVTESVTETVTETVTESESAPASRTDLAAPPKEARARRSDPA
jgi:hypothetical protein